MKERENIHAEIEKRLASLKKLKKVFPLVTIVVISFVANAKNLFSDKPYTTTTYLFIASLLLYVSCFVYAYYKIKSEIVKLEKQLEE